MVAVLTGMRLLAVDSRSWRVQLNLPLRKVQSVAHGPSHVLLLQLKPRHKATSAAAAEAAEAKGSVEMKKLSCHTEEASTMLHEQLQAAIASLNARRRIWIYTSAERARIASDMPAEVTMPMGLLSSSPMRMRPPMEVVVESSEQQ